VATDYLRAVSLRDSDAKPPVVKDKRVLVLGGGNVAVDAAMSSVRLGASWVGMTCLEGEGKMLAHDWRSAIAATRDRCDARPELPGNHEQGWQSHGVKTVNVNFAASLMERFDMDVIAGTETVVPCDIVIYAISQRPTWPF